MVGRPMGLRKPKSIRHNGKSLAEILEAHERFFSGKEGGARADLTGADLSHADLTGVTLAALSFETSTSKDPTSEKRDSPARTFPAAQTSAKLISGIRT